MGAMLGHGMQFVFTPVLLLPAIDIFMFLAEAVMEFTDIDSSYILLV